MKKLPVMFAQKRLRILMSASLFISIDILSRLPLASAADIEGTEVNPAPSGGGTANVDVSGNPIVKDIQLIVDFLTVGIGIIIIGVLIFGGIRYAAAGDSPQAVAAAKQHIVNGLIALGAYIFTFAFLQWVVPGGIF